LHATAWKGDAAQISELAVNSNANARHAYGRTPLHVATLARRRDAIRALVAAGADLRLADREGRTPLELARGRGYVTMSKMIDEALRTR